MQSTELTRRSLLGAISGSIVLAGCTGDDGDDGSGNGGDGNGNGDDDGSGNGDDDGSGNGDDDGSGNGDDDGSGNGDDDGSGNGDDDGMENGDDDGTENGDEQQEVVQVVSTEEHGDILAGPDGLTLYMFDSDEQGSGASSCTGGCADSWPPLTVDGEPAAGSGVEAELSTIEREDGTTQVTANGWPLYYWQGDEAEGDTAGQGVNQVWWVLEPDGTPIRGGESEPENGGEQEVVQVVSNEEYGDILAGPDGRTLYMFDSDEQGSGASSCTGGCADSWPPLTVDGEPAAGSGVEAELSTIERGDGTAQVTANGWPLYYFANDGSQGDATGQGVNDVWWVLAPDGTPIRGSGDDDGGDDGDDGDGGDDGDDGNDGNGGGDDSDDGDDGDDGNGGDDPGPY